MWNTHLLVPRYHLKNRSVKLAVMHITTTSRCLLELENGLAAALLTGVPQAQLVMVEEGTPLQAT